MNKRTIKTLASALTDVVADKVRKTKQKSTNKQPVKENAVSPAPGKVLNVGEPQYIGEFPVRCDIEIVPLSKSGKDSVGYQEWSATNSLMITLFGKGGKIANPSGIQPGDWILVRSVEGGFYGPVRTIQRQQGGLGAWVFCNNKKTLIDVGYNKEVGYWTTRSKV
jgi:hypothetical protein